MADDRDPMEWLADRIELLLGAFTLVKTLLSELPLPIEVPDLEGEEGAANPDAPLALWRAYSLMGDEPMHETLKEAHKGLIVQWFTAYEMANLIRLAGPMEWRMVALDAAIHHLGVTVQLIESTDLLDDDES